jgi:hypothetical protein
VSPSGDRLIESNLDARSRQPFDQFGEVVDGERRVGLLRRTKPFFDPEVKCNLVSLVPPPATCRLYRWFLEFVKTQQGHVELIATSLFTGGNGELYVMKLPRHAVSS